MAERRNITDADGHYVATSVEGALAEIAARVDDIVSGGSGLPDIYFVHHQAVAAATWTITHDLGWYPNVTVVTSAGDVVEGEIAYTSANQVVLTFSGGFSGTAYLS